MTVNRRRAGLAVIAAAVALCLAPAAGATPPERGSFDFTDSVTDTEVCAAAPWGIDVFVPVQHEY